MKGQIEKLAIANRGEVAVRIIRTCQELGIETVLLHSEADRQTLAYRIADETVCVGPASSGESYLNIEANIQGALSCGVDAIHPGFGFLSENGGFAEACEKNRLIFVGPSADTIRLFGDKISAKNLVRKESGPVIPGYQDRDQSEKRLLEEIQKIGFPVMIKAAGGGGGRGLKVVYQMEDAKSAIESAKREAQSAFGSEKVFLEKYLDKSKHIEVQIFGDVSGKVYHLFERECSVQRRHQKIIEEAVSPTLSEELRQKVAKMAVRIAEAAHYRGAGTVEFLFQDGQFYFMEMNTRLQVEHPVTEMVMGVDLVKAQIFTAQGQSLGWTDSPHLHGHAIECRIYAEDVYQGGTPSTGVLGGYRFPHGPGRRLDIGFEAGDEVTSFYDPMIGKVIVWDETRPRAIQKMIRTLQDTIIFGVKTNIPYLIKVLSHVEFVEGTMTTQFVQTYFPQSLKESELSSKQKQLREVLFRQIGSASSGQMREESFSSPWTYSWDGQ